MQGSADMQGGADGSGAERLAELEEFAVHLAATAGQVVLDSLPGPVEVRYKDPAGRPRDPVTDVDLRIERSLRDAITRRYPGHGILGEELGPLPPGEEGLVWAIDPIDGTTNFVHRLPLVAVSVACLERGVPLAGASWCSATHLFRPGVYHARRGHALRLCGEAVEVQRPDLPVGLLAASAGAHPPAVPYDARTTGSAAVDCAFTAAGILRAARLTRLHVWDVASGVLLVAAGGGAVLVEEGGRWRPFERFEDPLTTWRRSLLLGDPEVVDEIRGILEG